MELTELCSLLMTPQRVEALKAVVTDKKVKRIKSNFQLVRKKLVEVEEKDRVRNFKNPITGELIMQRYALPPCSTIGIIKEYVKEAILDGIIENNYEQAFQLMEKRALELGLTPQPLQKS